MKTKLYTLGIIFLFGFLYSYSQERLYTQKLELPLEGVVVGKSTYVIFEKSDFQGISIKVDPLDTTVNYISSLEKGKLIIKDTIGTITIHYNNPFKELEIEDNAYAIFKDSVLENTFELVTIHNDASLLFENSFLGDKMTLSIGNNSSIKWSQAYINELQLQGTKSSKIDINGAINELTLYKQDSVSIIGKYEIKKIIEENHPSLISIATEDEKVEDASGSLKTKNRIEAFTLNAAWGRIGWSTSGNMFGKGEGAYKLKNYGGFTYQFGVRMMISMTDKVKLYTGIGGEFYEYRFDKNFNTRKTNPGFELFIDDNPPFNLNNTKMHFGSLTIPALFEYQINQYTSFHFGIIGGINMSGEPIFSHKYKSEKGTVEEKWGDANLYLNRFKCDVQIGIGLAIINLYLRHSLTPLFKKDVQKGVFPYSIGISLGL